MLELFVALTLWVNDGNLGFDSGVVPGAYAELAWQPEPLTVELAYEAGYSSKVGAGKGWDHYGAISGLLHGLGASYEYGCLDAGTWRRCGGRHRFLAQRGPVRVSFAPADSPRYSTEHYTVELCDGRFRFAVHHSRFSLGGERIGAWSATYTVGFRG